MRDLVTTTRGNGRLSFLNGIFAVVIIDGKKIRIKPSDILTRTPATRNNEN